VTPAPTPALAAIVAMSDNRVIGVTGRLPWHLPDELAHFKRTTLARVCIMGRATFDSIGFPLKGRTNLVLTRDPAWHRKGVHTASTLSDALALARSLTRSTLGHEALDDPARCPIVLGGAQLYAQTLPLLTRLELTQVHATLDGDAHFPATNPADWAEASRTHHPADARHAFAYTVLSLDRRECL
jgi:dihydrofolate reductase